MVNRCFLLIVAIALAVPAAALAQPMPGDIFKEFSWTRGGELTQLLFGDKATTCSHELCPDQPPPTIQIDLDLVDAVRADVVVEHWSGHIGTSGKSIGFNGNAFLELPLPQGTQGQPECYYAIMSESAVEIPLAHLQDGTNSFTFSVAEQVCYGFNYSAWGVYGVNVRIYYSSSKTHATGTIIDPVAGATLGDFPVVEAQTSGSVAAVQFVGRYEDFDWQGNGVLRQWHSRYDYTELERHLGTDTTSPYRVTFDTQWVPDQSQPMEVAARVVHTNGTVYMTPSVDALVLSRSRSVTMYACSLVPENFKSRTGDQKSCTIDVADDPSTALSARLVVMAAASHDLPATIGLNGNALLEVPAGAPTTRNHQFREVEVPLGWVQQGSNIFHVVSDTDGHAIEVMWPGPALLLELPGSPTGESAVDGGPGPGDDGPGDDSSGDPDVMPLPDHVKINCGSNDLDVVGWMRDDAFVIGGDDWTNPSAVDTSAVVAPAPADVYRSVRHQSPHRYDIPVDNGTYLLRFHFADAFDTFQRNMNYAIEGELLLEGFEPVAEAGGINVALVREFLVTVDDGDGLQIGAAATGDVFEAGIELIRQSNSDGSSDDGDTVVVTDSDHGDGITMIGIRTEGCGCSQGHDAMMLVGWLLPLLWFRRRLRID